MDWHKYFIYVPETGAIIHKERSREMFADNWSFLVWNKRFSGRLASTICNGYLTARVYRRAFRSHRIIWEMFNGPIPDGIVVDHIDRDTLNNRIENLRLATHAQNQMNRGPSRKSKTGARGVIRTLRGRPYQAHICVNGKTIQLGRFDTIEDAVTARNQYAANLHGEFATPTTLSTQP